MKFNKKTMTLRLILALTIALPVMSAQAATALTAVKVKAFNNTTNTTATMSVKADSWYNLTMGYLGWTHHSNWGFVKLQRGKPVTIEVSTSVPGFHPAVSIWFRPGKTKIDSSIQYMNAHMYSQFKDIYEANPLLENTNTKLGKFQMNFVANGFDRDGMGDTLAASYDQSMLNRLQDGTPGKVSVSFMPEASGIYQFVVGGINPNIQQADKTVNGFYEVTTTVKFAQL
jgi:hypothetical protein